MLNDAYRTLRDPVARAEYLLKEEGFEIGEQRRKNVPPELLEEVFELNMALEELRDGRRVGAAAAREARGAVPGDAGEIDAELGRRCSQRTTQTRGPRQCSTRSAAS